MQSDGTIIEATLLNEQTLDNLAQAGWRLEELHSRIPNIIQSSPSPGQD